MDCSVSSCIVYPYTDSFWKKSDKYSRLNGKSQEKSMVCSNMILQINLDELSIRLLINRLISG